MDMWVGNNDGGDKAGTSVEGQGAEGGDGLGGGGALAGSQSIFGNEYDARVGMLVEKVGLGLRYGYPCVWHSGLNYWCV